MLKIAVGRSALCAGFILASILVASRAAQAQTTIGVGNPGPVVKQDGLLGTYYNFDVNGATPPGRPPGSPSATPATEATALQFLQRLDGPINLNFNATKPPGVQLDPSNAAQTWNFMASWTGFLKIGTVTNYQFGVASDDGESGWFGNVTAGTAPDTDHWDQRPDPGSPGDESAVKALAIGRIPVRLEFEQGYGGASIEFYWSVNGAAYVVVPMASLEPPDGPDAPTLTVTTAANRQAPQCDLSWTSAGTGVAATSWIVMRATASGGPYTQIAVLPAATMTYADTDPALVFNTPYYYIVQGTATNGLLIGTPSTFQSGTPPPPAIGLSPTGPITTSESGTVVTLRLTVNLSPTADGQIQINSSNSAQALVSGPMNGGPVQGPAGSITINVPTGTAVGTYYDINVTGNRDFIDNGNQSYTISFVVQNGGGAWTGATIPTVNGTNLDVDSVGVLITPMAGLTTTTSGGTATFSVTLNSSPAAGTAVSISVSSSDPTEGTVNPAVLTFTGANWNSAQSVIITGQGSNLTYKDVPYSVSVTAVAGPGNDPAYNGLGGTVLVLNRHLEAPPELKHVWGGSSSSGGGGCGLTGLDAAFLLGLVSLLRRRNRRA